MRVTFLDAIDSVAAEIEERLPGYFPRQPLRCIAPEDFCHRVAEAWDIPLVAAADEHTFNAVDRHLRDRLTDATFDEPSDLVAIREERMRRRRAAKARAALLPDLFEYRVAGPVRYAAIGSGEPLVCLNAIGHNVAAWLPLLEILSRRRRVLIWEVRPITFAEQCKDIDAILAHEGADRCHLIGWCTGAKLAARYAGTRRGAVKSMIFMGGSFKHPNRPRELDTAYERNLEAMLQAIVRQPSVAEKLRLVFEKTAFAAPDLDSLDGDALALRVLTGLPAGLELEARRPFAHAETLSVYARQHVEFWSHDETATASEVNVPILGIAGEHDPIVSPAGFRAALEQFPNARYEEIAATTHYCFYERPHAIADAIEAWIDCAKVRSHAASGHA
jgi:pimeloyl-ACP methyl ester carboxylesterase